MAPKPATRAPAAPEVARRPKLATAIRSALGKEQPEPRVLLAALTMDETAASLSCSVPTAYRLVSEGHLKTFLIGRKRYASPRALNECVERMEKLGVVLPAQSVGNNRTGPGEINEATRASCKAAEAWS